MKADIQKYCDILYESSSFRNDDDFDNYISSINFLKENKSPEVLRHLLYCLNDIDAGEIQYELIEACEEYQDIEFVEIFLNSLPVLKKQSPNWGALMLCSIFNSKTCKQIVIDIFIKLPQESQNTLVQ